MSFASLCDAYIDLYKQKINDPEIEIFDVKTEWRKIWYIRQNGRYPNSDTIMRIPPREKKIDYNALKSGVNTDADPTDESAQTLLFEIKEAILINLINNPKFNPGASLKNLSLIHI